MKTEILSRVADLIRNPDAPMRQEAVSEESRKTTTPATQQDGNTDSLEKPDRLTLSPAAQKLLEEADTPRDSQWEQNRSEKVDRVRELVRNRNYGFAPEVVDALAQKIVELLP